MGSGHWPDLLRPRTVEDVGERMKILYTTDLHGSQHYYNQIVKAAIKLHKVDMVINGGDMLPKTAPIFKNQPKFIKHLEKDYFPRFEKAGIQYLCCLGNDDLRIYDDLFDQACDKFENVHNIAGRLIEIGGLEFIGFNLVNDFPFELKDRVRMDSEGFVFPRQNGCGCFSVMKETGGGWEDIEDWISLAQSMPTLEDELEALVKPKNMEKAVYVMHMPPGGLSLDVCLSGDRPASDAVRYFLAMNQPFLSLHGHIHENFNMTGIWYAAVGDTIAVQPGQGGIHPIYCIIDTDDIKLIKRYGNAHG